MVCRRSGVLTALLDVKIMWETGELLKRRRNLVNFHPLLSRCCILGADLSPYIPTWSIHIPVGTESLHSFASEFVQWQLTGHQVKRTCVNKKRGRQLTELRAPAGFARRCLFTYPTHTGLQWYSMSELLIQAIHHFTPFPTLQNVDSLCQSWYCVYKWSLVYFRVKSSQLFPCWN